MSAVAPAIGQQAADHYQATLNLDAGASVYITAPTLELLAAIVAKTKGQLAPAPAATVTKDAAAAAGKSAPAPAAPAPSTAAPAPAATATTPASSGGEPVSQEALNKAVVDLVKAKGRDVAVATLKTLGVAKATEVLEARRAEALAVLTAALA
jgi:hypothetical protein